MSYESMITHMNNHHQNEMIALCKKFGNAIEVNDVRLESVDLAGLNLVYNGDISLRIEFPQKATDDTLKDSIISICQSANTPDTSAIAKEIAEFKQEFGSILIASVDENGQAICSYAPLMQLDNKAYIYISAVAEHFQSISNNPEKIEVMFLEDECKAKSVILRKRLKYRAKAHFIKRESSEFENALNSLESAMGGAGGIKTIRQMTDFHLIELQLGLGRFVKGFGQAYDILPNGEIRHVGGGNPHTRTNPHTHQKH